MICENEKTLQKGQRTCATATTIHCWTLGKNQESALPTVVICHSKRLILKRTMLVISQHGLLKAHGFGLRGCPSYDLKLLNSALTGQLTLPALSEGPPSSLCGAEIGAEGSDRKVTIGDLVVIDGKYYGITAAHTFSRSDVDPLAKACPDP